MYYKDPYPQSQGPYGGIKRSPVPSYGYANGNMMYGNANGNMYGNMMDTVTGYFSNPWVMIIGLLILVLIIVWLMSGKKDYYRQY